MTEVIYKVFYHTPVEGIEKEIEKRIEKKIYEALKIDSNLTGYHVTTFNTPLKKKIKNDRSNI